ncbi:MAG: cardiolipin synthase [Oscillibacter sp.]|nr:cardiolipin synthase [Oscillibacter sp.]
MREGMVLRLVKKNRKGLLHLVFSRFLVMAVLLAWQILLYFTFLGWLNEYLPHFTAVQFLFTLFMILYLFNSRMDSSAKLTWLAVIAIAPFVGTAFLAYSQLNLGHRATGRRTRELIAQTMDAIPQDAETLEQLRGDRYATDDLCRYLNRSGCFPIFSHTAVSYFPLGEQMFEAMLAEMEQAEKFIFLEYFIIEEGYMWGRILDILARKAGSGVDVRVLYDGMCEISTLPPDYVKRLRRVGIRAKSFSPLTPFLSTHYNYRDHRKILVIDGKTAFSGGVNLADEYINRKERYGHWKDTAVMLRGDAVSSFTLLFLQMWNLTEQKPDFDPVYLESPPVPEAEGYVMPFGDCPVDEYKAGENVYMDILNRAAEYIHIMTPYLILDGEMEAALTFAAQRGVDVKLILPGIPDKKPAYALAKSHYGVLLDAGVKIYEYTPGFVHAKVFVSDDRRAVVGTINLDYRSLYHHFECAAYLYRTPCIAEIERDFQETISRCRGVTKAALKHEKLYYKVVGRLLKLAAPLM